MRQVIEDKTNQELTQSILAEIAKARNEITCAQGDIQKAQSRLSFLVVLANELINRGEDK